MIYKIKNAHVKFISVHVVNIILVSYFFNTNRKVNIILAYTVSRIIKTLMVIHLLLPITSFL